MTPQQYGIIAFGAIVSGFFVYYPLTNSDIWWHLATAREFINIKHFFYYDHFAYTSNQNVWINLHWLFQVYAYAVYLLGGIKALLISKSLIIALCCVLLAFSVKSKKNLAISMLIMALLIYEVRYLILMRPILFTLLFISTYIFCLQNFIRSKNFLFLYLLIPVQIIWTNSQGLFILGPGILIAFWVGESVQSYLDNKYFYKDKLYHGFEKELVVKSIFISLIIIVSSFINPYGMDGFLFPFALFMRITPNFKNIYSANISENIPLFKLLETEPHYPFLVIGILALLIFSFIYMGNKGRLSHILLGIGFLVLAIMAKRNILLFILIAGFIFRFNLSRMLVSLNLMPKLQTGLIGILVLILGLQSFSHTQMLIETPQNSHISPFRHPVGAIDYLQKHPLDGNIFNSIRHGGYLMWKMYPQKKVFIDGRMIIRTPEFFSDYLTILDHPALFDNIAKRYNISQVLLPTAIFDRYLKLAKYLQKHNDWIITYVDDSSILYSNKYKSSQLEISLNTEEDILQITNKIKENYPNKTHVYNESIVHFGVLLMNLESFTMSEKVLQMTKSKKARQLLNRCWYLSGNIEKATKHALQLIQEDSEDEISRTTLAHIHFDKGNYKESLEFIIAVLKINPYNVEAKNILKQIKEITS